MPIRHKLLQDIHSDKMETGSVSNGNIRKRKLAKDGYEITVTDTEWSCLSPQYFMSNERLTRGRLMKDIAFQHSNTDQPTTSNNTEWDSIYLQRHFSGNERLTRSKMAKEMSCSNKEVAEKVYRMKCKRELLPLLDYHCSLAEDIATKCQKLKHSNLKQGPELPNIAQSNELVLTVVTNGDIKEDLPLIVRKQNLNLITYEQITEISGESKGKQNVNRSCCCLVFKHSESKRNVVCISSQEPDKIQEDETVRECEMTEEHIRKTLTHFLCEPLFSYAAEVLEKMYNLSQDPEGVVERAIQAAHALLNRKNPSRPSRKNIIPDTIVTALNKLRTDGILAFGLFETGMVIFADAETIKQKQARRRLEENVKTACAPVDKSPRVHYTIKSFLQPTSIKQGCRLKNQSTCKIGTLGMVTRANVKLPACQTRVIYRRTGESIGQDNRIQESDGEQKMVVGLTTGHDFNEGDTVTAYRDAPNINQDDLGRCIASFSRPSPVDVAVIKIEAPDKCCFNFYDEKGKLCNCVLMQKEMQIHDVVYKRGAVSGLTKGYIRSHLFQTTASKDTVPLCYPEQGYFIQGEGNKMFAEGGDSGSIVFFRGTDDTELETVQIVSIQSSTFKKDAAEKMDFPPNVSYTVRADRCFDKLRDEKSITMELPKKEDMR